MKIVFWLVLILLVGSGGYWYLRQRAQLFAINPKYVYHFQDNSYHMRCYQFRIKTKKSLLTVFPEKYGYFYVIDKPANQALIRKLCSGKALKAPVYRQLMNKTDRYKTEIIHRMAEISSGNTFSLYQDNSNRVALTTNEPALGKRIIPATALLNVHSKDDSLITGTKKVSWWQRWQRRKKIRERQDWEKEAQRALKPKTGLTLAEKLAELKDQDSEVEIDSLINSLKGPQSQPPTPVPDLQTLIQKQSAPVPGHPVRQWWQQLQKRRQHLGQQLRQWWHHIQKKQPVAGSKSEKSLQQLPTTVVHKTSSLKNKTTTKKTKHQPKHQLPSAQLSWWQKFWGQDERSVGDRHAKK